MPETLPKDIAPDEHVWTYRGYRIKSGEFVTAMVHFFRAEVQRANVWRQRLDTTTNWAVAVTGAILSIAFGQATTHHGVIILTNLLVFWFLFMEARRYRYYELWSYRIRLMETDFYAAMLVPPFRPSPEWAESLAESLLNPSFPVSMWEALGRRLRRNYLWIFIVLLASWVAKIWLFPQQAVTFSEMVERAAVGPISGAIIIGLGVLFYMALVSTAILTIPMTQATGEVLPRFGETAHPRAINGKSRGLASFLPYHRRRQFLAFIITDKADAVANRILNEMKRGVTALPGKGMFTGKERPVLMCALTVTEIHNLKSVVAKEDQRALVIVSPVQEVLGGEFAPLRGE